MAGYRTAGTDPYAAMRMQLAKEAQAAKERYEQQQLSERQAEAQMRGAEFGQNQQRMVNDARNNAIRNLLTAHEQRLYHEGTLDAKKTAEVDRNTQALLTLAANPIALQDFGNQAPAVRKAIVDKILSQQQIDVSKLAPDQKENALRQFAGKQAGAPGAAPAAPGGGAPAQAPAGGGLDPFEMLAMQQLGGAGGGGQPLNPVQDEAQAEAVRAMQRREALQGAGAVHYDPELQANVRTAADGSRFVVGAGDPSVGAVERSQFAPVPKGVLPGAGGTAFMNPSEGGSQVLGAPVSPAAARYREEWMARNAMTPFGGARPTAPVAPPAMTAAEGGQQAFRGRGAGSEFGLPYETPNMGRNVRVTQEEVNRMPAGAPPIDIPPVGSLKQPPPGSPYSTEAHKPFLGFIRFGANAPWSPTEAGQKNAWTVPPYMRGGGSPVESPPAPPPFSPGALTGQQPPVVPLVGQPPPVNAAALTSPAQQPPPMAQQVSRPVPPINYWNQ